jgi:HD-GYP domain-containing protein (c-di-GMP phosphodiesterase class II)
MSFSQSLEIRDANTAGHSRDVLSLGIIIAEKIGMRIDRMLKDSLLLHDIGKLGIPDRILLKESPLNDDEWQVMKTHPALGAALLGHFESYRDIGGVILAHQEHYDGTGYPKGLKGEEIPLMARIVGIADAYHAMTNNRPYRKAVGPGQAVQELRRYAGTQFDGRLVEAFVAGLREHNILKEAV